MNSLLYIGAGTDTRPFTHFPDVSNFVLVDTQPRSEFDGPIFEKIFYRSRFLKELISNYRNAGFVLKSSKVMEKDYYERIVGQFQQRELPIEILNSSNPTLFIFTNKKNQTIRYYTSTNLLYNLNDELIQDINLSNGLIVSGYYPEKIILNYISSPIHFYGYSTTWYGHITEEDYEWNSVMKILQDSPDQNYFDNFYWIDADTGEKTRMKDYFSFLKKFENKNVVNP